MFESSFFCFRPSVVGADFVCSFQFMAADHPWIPEPPKWTGPELPSGSRLPGIGSLGRRAGEVLDRIAESFRQVVDLPGDVYRVLTQVPDERALRTRLDSAGPQVVAALVPVTRSLSKAGELLPYGRHLQPLLLGKLFALESYATLRSEGLRELGRLPQGYAAGVEGLGGLLAAEELNVARALAWLPEREDLARLGSVEGWRDLAAASFGEVLEAPEAKYREWMGSSKRLERDLPAFRAAYLVTFQALASVDPLGGWIRRHAPAVSALSALVRRRDQALSLLEKLRALHVPAEPVALEEAPRVSTASSAPLDEPARPTRSLAPPPPRRLEAPVLPSSSRLARDGLPAPTGLSRASLALPRPRLPLSRLPPGSMDWAEGPRLPRPERSARSGSGLGSSTGLASLHETAGDAFGDLGKR